MATRITEIQRRFRCDFFAAQAFEHLEAQLAAVTAQRDELLRAAKRAVACGDIESQPILELSEAIARAQPEQPPQPKEEP